MHSPAQRHHTRRAPPEPTHGTVGVAPAQPRGALGAWSGHARRQHGHPGDACAAPTCYLGVQRAGRAVLIETAITARVRARRAAWPVEGAMETTLIVDLDQGPPRRPGALGTTLASCRPGLRAPAEDALPDAYGDLVLWLVEESGLDELDAYQLVTRYLRTFRRERLRPELHVRRQGQEASTSRCEQIVQIDHASDSRRWRREVPARRRGS